MAFDFVEISETPYQPGLLQIRYYAKVKTNSTQKQTNGRMAGSYEGQQVKDRRQYVWNCFQLQAIFVAKVGYHLF
jgi:hypothetical protein